MSGFSVHMLLDIYIYIFDRELYLRKILCQILKQVAPRILVLGDAQISEFNNFYDFKGWG